MRIDYRYSGDAPLGCTLAFFGMLFAAAAAWVTHIVVCIKLLTLPSIILLLIGVVVPPIGVIHGVMAWFGLGMGS